MNLSQLRIFKVVAELQSISRASDDLYIAQPSISRTISALEKELEVQLFDRRGRNIYLNQNGTILLKYTNEILSSIDRLKFELTEASLDSLSQMPINFYAGSRLIPYLAKELHERYPNIKFQLYRQPATQFERGNRGRMAIYADTKKNTLENSSLLLKEKIFAVVPKSNPLSARKSITLMDLKDEKIISCTRERVIRTNMDYYFKQADIKPNINIEFTEPSGILEFLASGMEMVTFIPQYSWGKIELPDNLCLIPISKPDCVRYIYLTWGHGKRNMPASVHNLEEILLELFERLKPEDEE